MTATKESGEADGFHGSIAGLGLSDVIQLNGNNRFSGCITVQHGASMGRIFFREGRIIHSEQGGKLGQEAFYDIMAWSSGHFSLEPNVSTTRHTIEMSLQHLLMEAHRIMDERRAGRGASPRPPQDAAPPVPPANKTSSANVLERLRAIPGVAYAVVIGKDGACVDDVTFEGEALAGKAAYVAMVGNRLGAALHVGQLRSAVVQRTAQHILLLAAKNHYLALSVAGAEVGAVTVSVRKLLGLAH